MFETAYHDGNEARKDRCRFKVEQQQQSTKLLPAGCSPVVTEEAVVLPNSET